jgi:hypothetical protein
MVQVLEENSSPIGRIGKGVGKGLAEQVPKEIDRYRLSSGLEKFAKESAGKSPFQQAVDFYKIPGATAEMGYTLFPLLQQEARRNASENITGGEQPRQPQPGATNVQVTGVNGKPYTQGQAQTEQRGLKPLSATQAQLTPIVRKSGEELFAEAAALSRANPKVFPQPEDAMPTVQANESTRLANLGEQRATGDAADALQRRIKGDLENAWKKDDTLKGIPGTVQSRIFQNIEDKLADPNNKKSESQLVKEGRELGEEIAKANTNLEASGKQTWYTNPSEIRNKISNIRNIYEKAGALEEYQDLLSSKLGFSPQIAAEFAYPLLKEERNYLRKALEEPERSALGSLFTEAYDPEDTKNKSVQAADKITKLIGENTSILSLMAEAKRKHLDPNIIMRRLQRNVEDCLITLTPRQERDFQKVIPDLPSRGDFYISLFLDDDAMVE